MACRAAVLVVRLGQCAAGDHDPWRLRCSTGELRGGRGAGLDRARALQRLLRHGHMARGLLEHENHPGRRLGAMRTGLTIGPPEDIRMTIQALGAAQLCTVYGSTETYGNCAVTDAADALPLRLRSQGLPLPGMTIRTVDPLTRQPLPPGDVGELAVRGHVTPGYFCAPELDAEAFDRDGYFLTGDLGSIDADGRIRFRGRLKEMIKTGGVNVAPLEVEQVLLQHPDIVQAYVVGIPDRSKGEIVAAAVELRIWGCNRSRGDRRLLP